MRVRRLVFLLVALAGSFAASVNAAQAGDYIVVLKDGVNVDAMVAKHKQKGAKVSKTYRYALTGYAANLSTSTLTAVRADPSVRRHSGPQDQAPEASQAEREPPGRHPAHQPHRRRSEQHRIRGRARHREDQRRHHRQRHRSRRHGARPARGSQLYPQRRRQCTGRRGSRHPGGRLARRARTTRSA